MKRILLPLLALVALTATAQVNTNMPTAATLPETVVGYFTSFDTNMATFTETRADLWTGATSLQNGPVPLVNDLALSYDIWRPTPAANSHVLFGLAPEIDVRNGGVAGTLVSGQGGLGFSLIVWDTKLTVYGDGGYYFIDGMSEKAFWEVGLRVKKGVGQHFYLGVGMGIQFPRNSQLFSVVTGATF